jgi:hypothetical protein
MSKLKEISGDLLAIANLLPENRNKALLDLSLIVQGWADYDIPPAQKDLIASIIEDLIAENDAEQIAKSKLVFVEEVEEQIAPTIKTRKKKVVAPVVEEDLPDFIDTFLLVKELPEQVKKLALKRQKDDNNTPNENLVLGIDKKEGNFDWDATPEGADFWERINAEGDLREFKEKYGNKGEKVDELIAKEEDLPDFINKLTIVKDLPEPVRKLVIFRSKPYPIDENYPLARAFDSTRTPEGDNFWMLINIEGDLREFKKKYGNKGEKVDELIAKEEDLPDFIRELTSVKNLPEPIRKLAGLRRKQQGVTSDINLDGFITGVFDINLAPEGVLFWDNINLDGDLREFKKLYGNKGEKIDDLIEFEELNQFVQTLTPPVASTPAPAPTPSGTTQMVKYVEVIVYPPSGGVLNLKAFSIGETMGVFDYLWDRLQMKKLTFNISAITDYSTYTTKIDVKTSESGAEIFEKLIAQFDTFVKPELDWEMFGNRKSDFDLIALNVEVLKDAFKPKVAPVVAPTPAPVLNLKPVAVEKPKPKTIVREKPRPVPVEKPKPVKVEKPKVEKVVKQKVTKPKVEDDLSFLDDLDNIF